MRKPEPTRPGQIVFTTKGLSPQDGFSRWRELLNESTEPYAVEANTAGRFEAQVQVQSIGNMQFFTNTSSQDFTTHVRHGKCEIARKREDSLVLHVQLNYQLNNYRCAQREATAQ